MAEDLVQTRHRRGLELLQIHELDQHIRQLEIKHALLRQVFDDQSDDVDGVEKQALHLRVHQHLGAQLHIKREGRNHLIHIHHVALKGHLNLTREAGGEGRLTELEYLVKRQGEEVHLRPQASE